MSLLIRGIINSKDTKRLTFQAKYRKKGALLVWQLIYSIRIYQSSGVSEERESAAVDAQEPE
jgi:hypothetical protein